MSASIVRMSRTVSAIRRQGDIPVVSSPLPSNVESVSTTETVSVAITSAVDGLPSGLSISSGPYSNLQKYGNCALQTNNSDLSAAPTSTAPHPGIGTNNRIPILTSSNVPTSSPTSNVIPSNVVSALPLVNDTLKSDPIESGVSTQGPVSPTSFAFLATTPSLSRSSVTATILQVVPHSQALDSPIHIAVETSSASPTAVPDVVPDVPNISAQGILTTTLPGGSTVIISSTIAKPVAISSTTLYQPISSSNIATTSTTLVAEVTQSDVVSTLSLSVPYPGSTNSTRNGQNPNSSAGSKTQKVTAIAVTITVLFVISAMGGLVYMIRRRRLRRRAETREGGRGHWANRQMSPYNHGSVAQHSFRPISELEVERSRFSFGSL